MKQIIKTTLSFIGIGTLIGGSPALVSAAPNTEMGFGSTTHVEKIHVPGTETAENDASLLESVRKFINWMLGMLALISFVICLWAGFQMMTAGADDGKYKKGFTIIKNAAIGLVVIGTSRLITSFIMRFIKNVTEDNPGIT